MPTRSFDKSSLVTIANAPHSASLEMSSYAAPLMRPRVLRNETLDPEQEWPAEAAVNVRLLVKGVGWALGIEGVAAISLYAVWHLWHTWR